MDAVAIERILREVPHMRAIDPSVLRRLAGATRALSLDRGTPLFREGDPCRAFFVVVQGGITLHRPLPDGRIQVLRRLRPGQMFAEAALLTMASYPVHAEANEPGTQVLEVDGTTFLDVFRADSRVAAAMVASLSNWLLQLVDRVDELSIANAGARLARHLLRRPSRSTKVGFEVELGQAKRELAEQLAIAPETFSRLLKKWKDAGIVESDGQRITILDADALEREAE